MQSIKYNKGARYNLYSIGLSYLSVSIIFEFIDQLSYFRLLGYNEVGDALLILRLFVDIFFVFSAIIVKINGATFRGGVIITCAILSIYGFVLGIIKQNEFIEIIKDLMLFLLFILKFVIFKEIFEYNNDMSIFYKKLIKYCKYTLYVGFLSLVIMLSLVRFGFAFYTQGVSSIEWYAAYAASHNRPIAIFISLIIAFFLAKRMVLLSVATILITWFGAKLFRGNLIAIAFLSAFALGSLTLMQLVTLNSDTVNYAIRLDIYSILEQIRNFSMPALQGLLMSFDMPRYLESASALGQLQVTGFWFGGGFGFEYLDVYTNEIVTNAHFSPVGLISKVGVWGMILFYAVLIYGALAGLKADNPLSKLCGYYSLATIVGSFMAWKFFLSSPLLPMALAAAIHYRTKPTLLMLRVK